jgi:hypothetical protein
VLLESISQPQPCISEGPVYPQFEAMPKTKVSRLVREPLDEEARQPADALFASVSRY